MAEPANANSAAIDPHFTKAFGQALEWEGRFKLCDHPGRVRLMAYLNRAHMGDYLEALAAMPVDPDVTLTRAYRFKYGCGFNFEQELTRDLGLWARLGWSDGQAIMPPLVSDDLSAIPRVIPSNGLRLVPWRENPLGSRD